MSPQPVPHDFLKTEYQNLIDASHVNSLRDAYPHIEIPTPAQEALLKALESPKDIFLRDRMGRGKYVTSLYPLHSILCEADEKDIRPSIVSCTSRREGFEGDDPCAYASTPRLDSRAH